MCYNIENIKEQHQGEAESQSIQRDNMCVYVCDRHIAYEHATKQNMRESLATSANNIQPILGLVTV